MTVVVKIKKERHVPAFHRKKDSGALGHLGKGAVAEVAIEAVELADVDRVQVGPAIAVEVASGRADGLARVGDRGGGRYVEERAVLPIVQEGVWLARARDAVGHVQVEMPVAVEVEPRGREAIAGIGHACDAPDVEECARVVSVQ